MPSPPSTRPRGGSGRRSSACVRSAVTRRRTATSSWDLSNRRYHDNVQKFSAEPPLLTRIRDAGGISAGQRLPQRVKAEVLVATQTMRLLPHENFESASRPRNPSITWRERHGGEWSDDMRCNLSKNARDTPVNPPAGGIRRRLAAIMVESSLTDDQFITHPEPSAKREVWNSQIGVTLAAPSEAS